MVVRGCTSDLLQLEVATKTILHFAKRASRRQCRFMADLCLLYSPLAWEIGERTNLDKYFLEEAMTNPIVSLHDMLEWKVDEIPRLNEVLWDGFGKHNTILT